MPLSGLKFTDPSGVDRTDAVVKALGDKLPEVLGYTVSMPDVVVDGFGLGLALPLLSS